MCLRRPNANRMVLGNLWHRASQENQSSPTWKPEICELGVGLGDQGRFLFVSLASP